jgi:oligopeptide transport system ATP-binding protein
MLLSVNNLRKYFPVTKGVMGRTVGYVKAVDDVSFEVGVNEVLGLVGESGCGKSTVARCIVRLIAPTAGSVRFEEQDLLKLRGDDLKKARRRLQIIFQDPLSSLNPRMTVEDTITEPMAIHGLYEKSERADKAAALLDRVGLPRGALRRYPHEFSGGQCQRIGIARALVLSPKLIIADEPVSALDVSVQAQIINLLVDLKSEMGLSYLFISHDLGVVRHISDRIAVMYLGKIVETGPAEDVCARPLHPYSVALMAAAPSLAKGKKRKHDLLTGDVPSPLNPPPGCTFHPRCPIAQPDCRVNEPKLEPRASGRLVRCPYAK